MNTEKRTGPEWDPRGTPAERGYLSEVELPILTEGDRSVRLSAIHCKVVL